MKHDVSTSLDDWFDAETEQRRVRFSRGDEVLLNSMALAEGVSVPEVVRRAVRERFLSTWPAQVNG
jgi:hypothetical protein